MRLCETEGARASEVGGEKDRRVGKEGSEWTIELIGVGQNV